jgi:hypothetical protein
MPTALRGHASGRHSRESHHVRSRPDDCESNHAHANAVGMAPTVKAGLRQLPPTKSAIHHSTSSTVFLTAAGSPLRENPPPQFLIPHAQPPCSGLCLGGGPLPRMGQRNNPLSRAIPFAPSGARTHSRRNRSTGSAAVGCAATPLHPRLQADAPPGDCKFRSLADASGSQSVVVRGARRVSRDPSRADALRRHEEIARSNLTRTHVQYIID